MGNKNFGGDKTVAIFSQEVLPEFRDLSTGCLVIDGCTYQFIVCVACSVLSTGSLDGHPADGNFHFLWFSIRDSACGRITEQDFYYYLSTDPSRDR